MTNTLVPFGTRHPELFDDFRREIDGVMSRLLGGDLAEQGDGAGRFGRFGLSADVAETEDAYEVTVDLPGLTPEEVTLELRDGALWIAGERRQEHEEKRKNWHRVERRYGQFCRVIGLGRDVDAEKVDAVYKDGVLKVTVPKSEAAKPKRIEIKS